MENPASEIEDVMRGVLRRPTFKQQAAVLDKFFTHDCELYHLYINIGTGLAALTAVYQKALFLVNYQDVTFRTVVYDPQSNNIAVRMSVLCKPWMLLWRTLTLEFHTLFELEDHEDEETGKTLKKIKVQRDYFIRSPVVQIIPVIGDIYNSEKLRYVWGDFNAFVTISVQRACKNLVPSKLKEIFFNFWHEHLQVPAWEQCQRFKAHTA